MVNVLGKNLYYDCSAMNENNSIDFEVILYYQNILKGLNFNNFKKI